MSTLQKWIIVTVVLAFASIISFFQINSYWADKHNFNTTWLLIGIITGLGAAYFGYTKIVKPNS